MARLVGRNAALWEVIASVSPVDHDYAILALVLETESAVEFGVAGVDYTVDRLGPQIWAHVSSHLDAQAVAQRADSRLGTFFA